MRCAVILALLLCPGSFVRAADSERDATGREPNESATQPEPVLLQVEKALRRALAGLDEEVTFRYEVHSPSLTVKYRTRTFMVHGGSKTGAFSEELREEEGPDLRGFLLRVHAQDKGTVNQAEVPQTIRRPYWHTDLDVTAVAGTDRQLYWALSYVAGTDRGLLKKIGEAIAGLGDAKKPRSVTVTPLDATTVKPHEPEISLFDSVRTVRQFLEAKAKQDYSDKYLRSVALHFSEGHPRKGACWLYHFAFKRPRFGGDVSIYHFMDGEIIEFHHGP
jgi:hypothetical protein